MKKIAVFVDWENLRQRVFIEAHKKNIKKVDYNDPTNLLAFIHFFIKPDSEEIYRIFFYLAKPYGETREGVDYSKTPVYQSSMAFLNRLAICDHLAIRKGYLALRGYDSDHKPIFEQKQVDMLIGLDIAHLSYNKLVDRALILCADTDIIPAMKIARINGIQVVYGYCPDVQNNVNRKLKEHADFVRPVDFKKIYACSC